MSSKFGWSYPPGCSGPPEPMEGPCDCCGNDPGGGCICPECPVCGEAGNPGCYGEDGHGLHFSEEQIAGLKEWQRIDRERREADRQADEARRVVGEQFGETFEQLAKGGE